jgi:hypothetical protein
MQNLLVEEGQVVTITSATLPKGTYVKLQPHTSVSAHVFFVNADAFLPRSVCRTLAMARTICLAEGPLHDACSGVRWSHYPILTNLDESDSAVFLIACVSPSL